MKGYAMTDDGCSWQGYVNKATWQVRLNLTGDQFHYENIYAIEKWAYKLTSGEAEFYRKFGAAIREYVIQWGNDENLVDLNKFDTTEMNAVNWEEVAERWDDYDPSRHPGHEDDNTDDNEGN